MRLRSTTSIIAAVAAVSLLAACGGSDDESTAPTESADTTMEAADAGPSTVRLLAHDSFVVSEDLLAQLKADTGITLEIVSGSDAGTMVAGAVLAAGNPTADVMFGVDNTLVSRALEADVFEPYTSPELASVIPPLREDTSGGMVTPIDYGDVCINIADTVLADAGVPAPTTLDDLIDPTYRDMLVVEDPGTSSPGLAFLLATIARYGDGWPDYWSALRDNGVSVASSWTDAYYGEFAGGGDGDRALVVSYATSPPAEIVYAADPKPEAPSTSVMLDGCFRQVEFAGVLRGTDNVDAARAVVDWLVSPQVQADIPLSMFVFPARRDTPLPEEFQRFALRPTDPLTLDADVIAENRATWVEQWTQTVLR